MVEYLVLLKINPGKIVDAMNGLRRLPDKPTSGVDLCYTMNIFGNWDVGVWIAADKTNQAIEFLEKKLKGISGIADIYAIPTFPHGARPQSSRIPDREASAEKSE